MDWQLIWTKIQELAISFYNFIMTKGESNFMLINRDLLHGFDAPDEITVFFIGSLVIMALLAVFACDSMHFFHPIQEIKEWGQKVSIIKVVAFSAAVFSIHTFYKMLVALLGSLIHAEASVLALDCLGSYINPISLMIYAYTVSTMNFRKKGKQAAFLGWSIFLTPALMSFYGFTQEHIALYSVGGVIGLVGGIFYNGMAPYFMCFVLYAVYFIAKYFMIYYSDVVRLLSGNTLGERIAQYLACIEVDIIVALILLVVLFGYRVTTTQNVKVVKELRYPIMLAVLLAVSIVCSNRVTVVAEILEKPEVIFDIPEKEQEEVIPEESVEEEIVAEEIPMIINVANANIRTGPGTEYEVITVTTEGTIFYGTGNEVVNDSGRLWYEIYVDEERTQIGWASEKVIEKQQ